MMTDKEALEPVGRPIQETDASTKEVRLFLPLFLLSYFYALFCAQSFSLIKMSSLDIYFNAGQCRAILHSLFIMLMNTDGL